MCVCVCVLIGAAVEATLMGGSRFWRRTAIEHDTIYRADSGAGTATGSFGEVVMNRFADCDPDWIEDDDYCN